MKNHLKNRLPNKKRAVQLAFCEPDLNKEKKARKREREIIIGCVQLIAISQFCF